MKTLKSMVNTRLGVGLKLFCLISLMGFLICFHIRGLQHTLVRGEDSNYYHSDNKVRGEGIVSSHNIKQEDLADHGQLLLTKSPKDSSTTLVSNPNVGEDDETRGSLTAAPPSAPPIILQPPYRIAAFGEPRTGSTFMYQLLFAIASIKTGETVTQTYETFPGLGNFVAKYHSFQEGAMYNEVINDKVSVFISTADKENIRFPPSLTSRALYVQELSNLFSCSLCEVDAYKAIFNMTDAEVQHVKDYMAAFEVIRTCCGLQMSKWERARLHGCNITEEERAMPGYPHCEDVNKTQIESIIESQPGGIKHIGLYPEFVWAQPGDCEKFDNQVKGGMDFNGEKFNTSVETCHELKNK